MKTKKDFLENGVCVLSNLFSEQILNSCLNDLLKFDNQSAIASGAANQIPIGLKAVESRQPLAKASAPF